MKPTATDYSGYIPGVCNIGPVEIRRRMIIGWTALAVSVTAWATLVYLGVNGYWLALLLFPSTVSAAGFIQARKHFCLAYGMKSLYNFTTLPGRAKPSLNPRSIAEDRKQALRILGHSILAGFVFTLVALFAENISR